MLLGIEDFGWQRDRTGNPFTFAGLRLHALDFARVGQMMLDGGTWRGKRIINRSGSASRPGPSRTSSRDAAYSGGCFRARRAS
jgi:CubicO group peptidase (beta-lactamase class C family)